MPNATYVGREATITRTPSGGIASVIGVAETCELNIEQELLRVYGNSHKPADIKEDTQDVTGVLRKAYVDAEFWNAITRDANGYLTEFTVAFKVKDKSSGVAPYPYITITATGCKAKKWGLTIPNRGAVLVENLEFVAKDAARTTGAEA